MHPEYTCRTVDALQHVQAETLDQKRTCTGSATESVAGFATLATVIASSVARRTTSVADCRGTRGSHGITRSIMFGNVRVQEHWEVST